MAVTRLERKGRKDKNVAKNRVTTMKHLNTTPAIKKVDIEKIKADFTKNAGSKKEVPKVEKTEDATKKETTPKAKSVKTTAEKETKKVTLKKDK